MPLGTWQLLVCVCVCVYVRAHVCRRECFNTTRVCEVGRQEFFTLALCTLGVWTTQIHYITKCLSIYMYHLFEGSVHKWKSEGKFGS